MGILVAGGGVGAYMWKPKGVQPATDPCSKGDPYAQMEIASKVPEQARTALQCACQTNPEGCIRLAQLEVARSNTAAANTAWRRACEMGAGRGCYELGVVAETSADDLQSALSHYKRGCDLDHPDACTKYRELETRLRPPCKRAPEADLALLMGYVNGTVRDAKSVDPAYWEEARVVGERVTTLDPECAFAWSAYGHVLYRIAYDICGRGDYRRADEALAKARSLGASDKWFLRNLGRVAAARLNWNEAISHFRQALDEGQKSNNDKQDPDTLAWLDRLTATTEASQGLVAAAAKVATEQVLAPEEIAALTLEELVVVHDGIAANSGVRLNWAPTDWFYYCEDSPLHAVLETPLAMNPRARREHSAADRDNLSNIDALIAQRRKELRP